MSGLSDLVKFRTFSADSMPGKALPCATVSFNSRLSGPLTRDVQEKECTCSSIIRRAEIRSAAFFFPVQTYARDTFLVDLLFHNVCDPNCDLMWLSLVDNGFDADSDNSNLSFFETR